MVEAFPLLDRPAVAVFLAVRLREYPLPADAPNAIADVSAREVPLPGVRNPHRERECA
jgi:hypothetical protein